MEVQPRGIVLGERTRAGAGVLHSACRRGLEGGGKSIHSSPKPAGAASLMTGTIISALRDLGDPTGLSYKPGARAVRWFWGMCSCGSSAYRARNAGERDSHPRGRKIEE